MLFSVKSENKFTASNLSEKVLFFLTEEVKEDIAYSGIDFDHDMSSYSCKNNALQGIDYFAIPDDHFSIEHVGNYEGYYNLNNEHYYVDYSVCKREDFLYEAVVNIAIKQGDGAFNTVHHEKQQIELVIEK
ncbi:hypothetical protein [Evansella halocellulosilytica]|uniref:hypothetical protein n=1 Tax=Evansella halocellulosilytica TaxID=2011013 RepID=UPI000BB80ADF|nr:hypothetical protein [Evansella halocellulosilytica]